MEHLARHAQALGNVTRVDVLPFHQMGGLKWDELNLEYQLHQTPEPSSTQVEETGRLSGRPDLMTASFNGPHQSLNKRLFPTRVFQTCFKSPDRVCFTMAKEKSAACPILI